VAVAEVAEKETWGRDMRGRDMRGRDEGGRNVTNVDTVRPANYE
jgi:hypothetical protein